MPNGIEIIIEPLDEQTREQWSEESRERCAVLAEAIRRTFRRGGTELPREIVSASTVLDSFERRSMSRVGLEGSHSSTGA